MSDSSRLLHFAIREVGLHKFGYKLNDVKSILTDDVTRSCTILQKLESLEDLLSIHNESEVDITLDISIVINHIVKIFRE